MRGNLFAVAVDLVVLTVRDGELCVLLLERATKPFLGELALPGGFVRPAEDLLDAATRELVTETGLVIGTHHLEQLASYAAPDRDPRGRVLTVGHLALVPDLPEPEAGAGADSTGGAWHPVAKVDRLAFDHAQILADGVERARAKLEYTTLAAAFCPPEFTISQLRRVYEAVWGTTPDPRNFSRKVTTTPGFLVPTGEKLSSGRGRPGQLFRRGPATALHPPMLRSDSGGPEPP
jgi:8-oxo-dGTP diphosphatase